MKMSDEEYMNTQVMLTSLAMIVSEMNIEGFIHRINECETIAPILDPTLFIKGSAAMENFKRLAFGALDFQRIVGQLNSIRNAEIRSRERVDEILKGEK